MPDAARISQNGRRLETSRTPAPHASPAPKSSRLAWTALLMAKSTAAPRKKGGSPTALDEWTANSLSARSNLRGTQAFQSGLEIRQHFAEMFRSTPGSDTLRTKELCTLKVPCSLVARPGSSNSTRKSRGASLNDGNL